LSDLFVLFFEIPKSGAFPIPTRLRFPNRTLAAGQSSIPSPEEPKQIRRLSSGTARRFRDLATYSGPRQSAYQATCAPYGTALQYRQRHPGLRQSRFRLIPCLLAKLIPAWLCLGGVKVAQFAPYLGTGALCGMLNPRCRSGLPQFDLQQGF
jgi:hypothetical protein